MNSARRRTITDRAWYDLKKPGLVRDVWVILHPQYSMWFLAYSLMGAAIAPLLDWDLLGWTVLSFTLGMVIAAHLIDEYNGRPLQTSFPGWLLVAIAAAALLSTIPICIILMGRLGPWIWAFWALAVWGVLAYNLEKPKWMHSDLAFAVLWGAFPVVTAYWIQTQVISWSAIALTIFALLTAYAQRVLSMQSRLLRRELEGMDLTIYWTQPEKRGMSEAMTWVSKAFFLKPVDMALKLLNAAIVLLAVTLLLTA